MGEQRQVQRPALRVLKGGGQAERRALRRLTGGRHRWLLALGIALALLAGAAFLFAPAFTQRVPHLTPEEVAASQAASGAEPLVKALAEVLDLDPGGILALRQGLDRFDARAAAPLRRRDLALRVLRGAASGAGAEAGAVDTALEQLREAQRALADLDGELVEAVSAGRTPSQKARAALLLGRHHERVAPEGRSATASPEPGAAAAAPPTSHVPGGDPGVRLAPAATAPATKAPAARP